MSLNNLAVHIYDEGYESLNKKLKPILCDSCRDEYSSYGECPTCLKNRAYNIEFLTTHSFITDKFLESYHCGRHSDIKCLPLRLPTERPKLFYGIEVELSFIDDIYDYDEDEYYDEDEGESYPALTRETEETMEHFTKITNGLFVYERDGSVSNGFELISRPCSYAYWTSPSTVKALEEGFEYLKSHGVLVNQPDGNGMHIHLSNAFFEAKNDKFSVDSQDAYKDFNWLFQIFQPEIEKLGKRKYTCYCQSDKQKAEESLRYSLARINSNVTSLKVACKMNKSYVSNGDHSSSVTMSGRTIEARVFRSTTDYKQILANIEIVRNFAHAVRNGYVNGETERSLNELLHTKDNLFLDELISKTKMQAKKNNEDFDIDTARDNEIEINIEEGR